MSKVLSNDEIIRRGNEVFLMSCKPDFKKLPVGYITDENQSVKWNREQVEISNARYNDEVARLNSLKNAKRDELYEDIYATIQDYVGHGFTREQAITVWNYAYSKGHAYGMSDIVSELDDLVYMVRQLYEVGSKKKKER